MPFDSWQAFWAMGGYGFYVWLSFAVTLVVMLGLIVEARFARRKLLTHFQTEAARKARIAAAKKAAKPASSNRQQEVQDS